MLQVSAGAQLVVYALVTGSAMLAVAVVVGVLMRTAGPGRPTAAAVGAGVGLAAWFAVAGALAQAGPLGDARTGAPVLGLRIAVPLAAGALAIALVEPLRRLLAGPDVQPALVAVQTYRVLGGVFLALLAAHALPAAFAIPAGAGDVLIGLTAVRAARSLRRGRPGPVVAWNLLGLLDLAVAVTLGVAAAPGALRLIDAPPGTAALGVLPLVLVPTFLVPLSVLLHAVSLRALLARGATAEAYA